MKKLLLAGCTLLVFSTTASAGWPYRGYYRGGVYAGSVRFAPSCPSCVYGPRWGYGPYGYSPYREAFRGGVPPMGPMPGYGYEPGYGAAPMGYGGGVPPAAIIGTIMSIVVPLLNNRR